MKRGEQNAALGTRGEEVAVSFLKGLKYRIVERNFRCAGGEVDIIAKDGRTIVFIEVKTRKSAFFGTPEMAVTDFKQRQISKAALTWLSKNRLHDAPARFDVLAILLPERELPAITHFTNAFDLRY